MDKSKQSSRQRAALSSKHSSAVDTLAGKDELLGSFAGTRTWQIVETDSPLLAEVLQVYKSGMHMVDIEAIVHSRLKEGRDYRRFRSLVLRSGGVAEKAKGRGGRGKTKGGAQKKGASKPPESPGSADSKPRVLSAVTFCCHEASRLCICFIL